METWNLQNLSNQCYDELRRRGVTLEVSTDFESSQKAMAEIVGKRSFTPGADTAKSDPMGGNSFWLFMRKDGVLIGGACANYYDLGAESVQSYWRRSLSRGFSDGDEPILDFSETARSIGIERRFAYLSDLEVKPEYRGDPIRIRLFMHYFLATAALRWSEVEMVCGFIRSRGIAKGKHCLYGFSEAYPGVMRWLSDVPSRRNSDFFVCIRSKTLDQVCSLYRAQPDLLTSEDWFVKKPA